MEQAYGSPVVKWLPPIIKLKPVTVVSATESGFKISGLKSFKGQTSSVSYT